jgi:glycosyltransferase involved in cell wall biosynthesis
VRVLHVAPTFYPALVYGGPTQSTYSLCVAEAQARGEERCDVRVLTTDGNGSSAVLDVDTAREVTFIPNLAVRYCPRVWPQAVSPALLRLLPEHVRWAEVVHLMAVYSFTTLPTLLAASLWGRPVVWSPRGMLQRWEASTNTALKGVWDQACRLLAPREMTLCFTSQQEADESNRRFHGFPSVVIPNGVDLPEQVEHVDDPGVLRVLFLGRLHPIKGLENLIAGFARYRARAALPARLTIAGGGDPAYEASLRARVAELGLEGHVTLPGATFGDAKRALFARADVVVVPSFRESFSIVVIEALASGVPVIAGRGTPWQQLEEEGAGLWVESDPESLAGALARIAAMPRREMGQRGRAWARRAFTWDLVAEQTIDLYREVAGRRGGGRA